MHQEEFSRDPSIAFVNDPEFRASQLEHDRNEEVCNKMDDLAQKDFRHHMTQAEYFRYRKNWWISLKNFWKIRTIERSFWLQRCVVHIKPSTPRIWRTTTQASAILEVSILAPIIEFFLQLVAMERFLVELIIIQMKVHTMSIHAKRHDRTGRPVVCRLWIRPQTCDFHIFFFILLQLDRLQLTAVCCNRWWVCKENTWQDHFRSVNLYKEFAYRLEIE